MGLLYRSILSMAVGKDNPEKTNLSLSENTEAEKEISAYIVRHPKLSGIIFDVPQDMPKEESDILSSLIKGAVSSIGIGVRLRSKRTLVLIPASLDQELVSHRIRANFQIKTCYSFSTTSFDDIKAVIENY